MKQLCSLLVLVTFVACTNGKQTSDTTSDTLFKNEAEADSVYKLDTPKMRNFNGVQLYAEGEETYLQEIKLDNKVIEALVTDAKVLYVTVRDDGTSQKSYAEYLCTILAEFDADISKIKVVKAVSIPIKNKAEKDFGVVLGEASCK